MIMKILPFCLLVLLLPLQASASVSINENNEETSYEKFKRQHIDEKMKKERCTAVMKRKWIYDSNNQCKQINTFILAAPKKVKSICKGQGTEINGKTYSKNRFRVVVCTLKGGKKPMCDYTGTLLTNRIIVVDCRDGLPVHFVDSL